MDDAKTSSAESTIACDSGVSFNDGDIIVRSTTAHVDFRVHRAFLAVASPFFRDMFSLPQSEQPSRTASVGDMEDGLPIVPFEEDPETLRTLLQLCYPRYMFLDDKPIFPTIERVLPVLIAAKKYAMDGVEREIRAVLISPQFVDPDPLRVFALAVKHGMYEEAKICARHTLLTPVLAKRYIPELENITGGAYHHLQEYHIRCGVVAAGVVQDLRWITNETSVWFDCSGCRGGSPPVVIAGDRRKWVAKWWTEFMLEAGNLLRECPSGVTVGVDSHVVQMAMEKASTCVACRSRALREIKEFCAIFAAQVDKIVDGVEFGYLALNVAA
ncbi:hypothetical protein C8F04DRAFT_1366932 [Mycena alexandri]|uniref:BTB domain-containing protein n=1 Tax=Mycena alexandri TaxID=1745969 RepID=A0AAD6TEA7_9AGAR|nr:hypothetical protein C8F04DRAFT_1366932 [Mycena alexandri]